MTYSATDWALAPVAGKTLTPPGGAGLKVDVVQSHAEAADGNQAGGRRQQGVIHPGLVADDQCPSLPDLIPQCLLAGAEQGIIVNAVDFLKAGDGILGHEFGNNDIKHRFVPFFDSG